MSHYQSCALCGVEGPQVRIALVEWAEPEERLALTTRLGLSPPERFSVIPRCSDVADCEQRVRQTGDTWPLARERTTT